MAEKQWRFTIRATFTDASSATWPAVDICRGAYITLYYRNGRPTITAQ